MAKKEFKFKAKKPHTQKGKWNSEIRLKSLNNKRRKILNKILNKIEEMEEA